MRDRILAALARAALRRPKTIIAVSLIVAAVCAVHAALNLRMNANTDDLIGRDRPYYAAYDAFLEEFGDLEYLYVVIERGDRPERAEACVDALTERLGGVDGLEGVHGFITATEQRRIATAGMADDELAGLAMATGGVSLLTGGGGAGHVLAEANKALRRLILRPSDSDEAQRSGARAILALEAVASTVDGSRSAEEMAVFRGRRRREYLTSDTGQLYFIAILPAKDYGTLAVIEEPLRHIRDAMAAVRADFPGVSMGLTGKPVLQADEMATTNRDMTIASVVAVLLVAILFMVVMGGVVRPALAVGALLVGIAWTFGLTTVVVGQLNLLSVVFTLILVGVGVDFGVHIVTRYVEELIDRPVPEALEHAMVRAGRGNVTGALTSSAAFFCTLFTDFQGLRELGFIAGTGLLLCLLAMSVLLPALIVVVDGRGTAVGRVSSRPADAVRGSSRRLLVIGGLTLLALPLLPRVGFQDNVLDLQAKDIESVEWEHRVLADSNSATWFGAMIVDDLEALPPLVARARECDTVGAVHSVLDVMTPDNPSRRASLDALIAAAESPGDPPDAIEWQHGDVADAARRVRRLAALAQQRAPTEAALLEDLGATLAGLAARIEAEPEIKEAVETAVAEVGSGLRTAVLADRLPLRDRLPSALRDLMISPNGRYLAMVHPDCDVWEITALATFVDDMRVADPGVTGVPITHLESVRDMRNGFVLAALLALGVVVLIVALDFRSFRDAALAVGSLFLAALWTVEAMGGIGLNFNLANFFAVPILIGIGVDNGIHMVHRWREGGRLGATRRGVFLTSATSMIGFGCLASASHRGLRSLGLVMALGCLACMIASLVVLPAILRRLRR